MSPSAAVLLRQARQRAHLTQRELAERAGVAQSVISTYELAGREPSLPTLERLIAATGFTLNLSLRSAIADSLRERLASNRVELLASLSALGAERVRVFGSVARGDAGPESDIDLLVDLTPDTGLFALARMHGEAERILGVPVDIVPADSLKPDVAASALAEALPL